MILGTVQYMAPEQVEGKEADARSDIWAFGTVLYEMVTGTRPFQGDTPASVIGAILKGEPLPVSSRQPLTPPMLDRVVALCFEKDPDARWRSAADLQLVLKWVGDGALVSTSAVPRRSSGGLRVWLPLTAAGIMLIGVLTLLPGWWAHRGETLLDVLQLLTCPRKSATRRMRSSVVHVRAHDAAAGVAFRRQQEMAHLVGDDIAEPDREKGGGGGPDVRSSDGCFILKS